MKNLEEIKGIAKLSSLIRRDEKMSTLQIIIIVLILVAVAAVVAYLIYKFFAPDYLDDFDDFDDDFEDGFFDDDLLEFKEEPEEV